MCLKSYQYLIFEFPPKQKMLTARTVINIFKGATLLYCLLVMYLFQNFNNRAVLYTCLHGSYGMIWLWKDLVFPDKTFMTVQSLGSNIAISTFLIAYWTIGYFAISNKNDISVLRFLVCGILYALGVFLMIGSDI